MIDHAFGGDDTPAAGLGISSLGTGRDCSDLNMTETHASERAHMGAGFIHAGGKPDGVREAQSHDGDGIILWDVGHQFDQSERHGPVNVIHDHRVGGFRGQAEKN